MNLNEKIEQLEKELAELKQEVVSRNNQQTTINSIEDAFNLLKPKWAIVSDGDICEEVEIPKFKISPCNMTSEKRAKQIKALIQLHLVAEAMNHNFGRLSDNVFVIDKYLEVKDCDIKSDGGIVQPTFITQKLAEQALEKFKPLFMDLYLLND